MTNVQNLHVAYRLFACKILYTYWYNSDLGTILAIYYSNVCNQHVMFLFFIFKSMIYLWKYICLSQLIKHAADNVDVTACFPTPIHNMSCSLKWHKSMCKYAYYLLLSEWIKIPKNKTKMGQTWELHFLFGHIKTSSSLRKFYWLKVF